VVKANVVFGKIIDQTLNAVQRGLAPLGNLLRLPAGVTPVKNH